MEWKDFLKPDWKKIVLAVLLLLFLPGPVDLTHNIACNMSGPCYWPDPEIQIIPFGFLIMVNDVRIWPEYIVDLQIYLWVFVLDYILSCTIIFLYNKHKRSK